MHIKKIKNNIGATAIEYALLAFLIAVGLTTSMISISGSLSNTFCAVSFGLSKTSCANSGSGSGTSSSGSGSSNGGSSSSSSSPEDNETAAFDDLSNVIGKMTSNIDEDVNAYVAAWKATESARITALNAFNAMNACNAAKTTGCPDEQSAFNSANIDFENAKNIETPLKSKIEQDLGSQLTNFGSAWNQAKAQYGVDAGNNAANDVLQQTLTDTATGNSFPLNTMFSISDSNPGVINNGNDKTGGGNFLDDLMGAYPVHNGWITG